MNLPGDRARMPSLTVQTERGHVPGGIADWNKLAGDGRWMEGDSMSNGQVRTKRKR